MGRVEVGRGGVGRGGASTTAQLDLQSRFCAITHTQRTLLSVLSRQVAAGRRCICWL